MVNFCFWQSRLFIVTIMNVCLFAQLLFYYFICSHNSIVKRVFFFICLNSFSTFGLCIWIKNILMVIWDFSRKYKKGDKINLIVFHLKICQLYPLFGNHIAPGFFSLLFSTWWKKWLFDRETHMSSKYVLTVIDATNMNVYGLLNTPMRERPYLIHTVEHSVRAILLGLSQTNHNTMMTEKANLINWNIQFHDVTLLYQFFYLLYR